MASGEVQLKVSGDAEKIAAALKHPEPRVRIESKGLGTTTTVYVGDQVLSNVLSVKWSMDLSNPGVVTLELDDVDVVIDQGPERWTTSSPNAQR